MTSIAVAITGTVVVSGAVGGIVGAGALLYKYGLTAMNLHRTNMMKPETCAKKMRSTKVLRVKHAPDMSLLETVQHCTYLLSKENMQSNTRKGHENLKREIQKLSQEAMAENAQEAKVENPLPGTEVNNSNRRRMFHACSFTATSAAQMQRHRTHTWTAVSKLNRNKLFNRAKRCLAWAQDPARPVIPGAEHMTNEQVRRCMTPLVPTNAKDRSIYVLCSFLHR